MTKQGVHVTDCGTENKKDKTCPAIGIALNAQNKRALLPTSLQMGPGLRMSHSIQYSQNQKGSQRYNLATWKINGFGQTTGGPTGTGSYPQNRFIG
tara:strand:+ start:43 stop:330 length:288 start_codon:yes stop_codon:yes gene_type:complete